jgi:hypothetical protein
MLFFIFVLFHNILKACLYNTEKFYKSPFNIFNYYIYIVSVCDHYIREVLTKNYDMLNISYIPQQIHQW